MILCFEREINEFVTCHLPVGAGSLVNNLAEKTQKASSIYVKKQME